MARWHRAVLVAGAMLGVAACSDDNTGSLADPAAVAAELAAVNDVFETSAFLSFERAGPLLRSGPFPQAAALAAAAAPGPRLLDDRPTVRAALAAKELTALAPLYSVAAPQDSFLPDSVLGTYEWDVATDQYFKSADPAPANTVRIILYAIDPITHMPIEPVDEVGYLDLTDNQTVGVGGSLGIVVKDSAGTTTYVDYDVTVTGNPSGFGANATGFVSNGQGRRLDFSVQFLATGTNSQGTLSVDATVSVNQPSIVVEVHDAVSLTATTAAIARDFRVERGGESIRVSGNLLVVETAPDTYSITLNITVTVNGGVWLTVQGTDGGITVTKADGTALTQEEQAALGRLLDGADEFLDDLGDLFEPVEVLTGS